MTDRATRRRILTGTAAVAAAVTGCSRQGGEATATLSSGSAADPDGPFRRLSVTGTTLVIEVSEEADVEQVNVLAPDGSRIQSASVVVGQTRVTVDLGVSYDPGRYEITTEGGERTAIELEPELSIEELGVGANNPEVMPDSLDSFEPYAATIVVRNSGTGPTAVDNLALVGDVPAPTDDIIDTPETGGIVDPETGSAELDSVLVPHNTSLRIFSSTLPFLFAGQPQSCESMPEDATITVRVTDTISSETTERQFDAGYESNDECVISIGER
jgi:hypothetical protein